MKRECIFPIRHMSPGSSYHLLKYLNKVKPEILLIEGPIDFNESIESMTLKAVKPPIAIMAYTEDCKKVQSILYPFTEYSPEYVAIKWAKENNKIVKFCDIPSSVFLKIGDALNIEEEPKSIFEKLSTMVEEEDYDAFWDKNFELNVEDNFRENLLNFTKELREEAKKTSLDMAEISIREGFMKGQFLEYIKKGYKEEEIILICGAYHVEGILDKNRESINLEDIKNFMDYKTKKTLIPYSYKKISLREGYGAGNKAPYYYSLLWKHLKNNTVEDLSYEYCSEVCRNLREDGMIKSTADIIDGVVLSKALANLRGRKIEILRDIRDSLITTLGEGEFFKISKAIALTEVGLKVGSVPEKLIDSAILRDFNKEIKRLRLGKYKDISKKRITLKLKKNLKAKNKDGEFLDLERDRFFNRTRVLKMDFASQISENNLTDWIVDWELSFNTTSNIALVLMAMNGETIEKAALNILKERLEALENIKDVVNLIEEAYKCGYIEIVLKGCSKIKELSIEENDLEFVSEVLEKLNMMVSFKDIRCLNLDFIDEAIREFFIRASFMIRRECLNLSEDREKILKSIESIFSVYKINKKVDGDIFKRELKNCVSSKEIDSVISGRALAILIQIGDEEEKFIEDTIKNKIRYKEDVKKVCGFVEGLLRKNPRVILEKKEFLKVIDSYIGEITFEEFKNILVPLHRSFSEMTSKDKLRLLEEVNCMFTDTKEEARDIIFYDLSMYDFKEF